MDMMGAPKSSHSQVTHKQLLANYCPLSIFADVKVEMKQTLLIYTRHRWLLGLHNTYTAWVSIKLKNIYSVNFCLFCIFAVF